MGERTIRPQADFLILSHPDFLAYTNTVGQGISPCRLLTHKSLQTLPFPGSYCRYGISPILKNNQNKIWGMG